MLAADRHKIILELVNSQKSVSLNDLVTELGISESTIRRDLDILDHEGKLTKVRGGAVSSVDSFNSVDESMTYRNARNVPEKKKIGKAAAELIEDNDFVFMDAGTTIAAMIEFISARNVTFVTNAISNATALASKGFSVHIIGGEFKAATEAIVGCEAIESISTFNFSKGFFGVNGISEKNGCTTPETKEAMFKKNAVKRCKECYVLCDSSKFDKISSVKFADFDSVTIITDKIKESYDKCSNIRIGGRK